jgi:uncharacterized protein (TIGR00661 family)
MFYADKFLLLKLIVQIPKFLKNIKRERKALRTFLGNFQADMIISDNRYGFYHKNIPSLLITHQVTPKLPAPLRIFEFLVFRLLKVFLNRFDAVLIPDFKGDHNLSGKLSHQKILPQSFFIGPLSQFAEYTGRSSGGIKSTRKNHEILVIISGPEPQRTNFERIIVSQIEGTDKQVLVVTGKPGSKNRIKKGNIEIVNHLNRKEMYRAIICSDIVISRAGYTTICDLSVLKKKAILVPTPGQTEQEYLQAHLEAKKLFIFQRQKAFDLESALLELSGLQEDFEAFDCDDNDDIMALINSCFS